MADVLLQAGHYPSGGGAPGEAAWCWDVANLVAERLRARGLSVEVVGDFYGLKAPAVVGRRHTLFVSLHYDAPTKRNGVWDDSGCFCDYSPTDPLLAEAERFRSIWEPLYSHATGIGVDAYRGVNNPNTDRYYAWASLHPDTVAVILEHGCGSPVPKGEYPKGDDADFLHANKDLVADLDAAAILRFLGVAPEPEPEDTVPLTPDEEAALQLLRDLSWNAGSIITAIEEIGALNAVVAEQGARITSLEQQLAAVPPPPPPPVPVGVSRVTVTATVALDDGREAVASGELVVTP